MNIVDLLTSPWAILPDRLLEIQSIYATHLRGDKIDIKAIEAQLGRPLSNEQQTYTLREGGVGLFPVTGVLAPKANLFMQVSGGQSMQMMVKQVRSMQADSRVRTALIAVDSPGGSVLGTPAFAAAVRELAAVKPTVVVGEGTMASAMYWVATAANAIFIEGLTDMVGSIGVVAVHDYEPKAGRVSTEITAGRYKRMAASGAPLTEEGRAYMQQMVDENYRVFVDAVAENRGVSTAQVLERMADGRVFIGQQAIDAGLVDGVSTVEAMVERLATRPDEFAQRRQAQFALGGMPAPLALVAVSIDSSLPAPLAQGDSHPGAGAALASPHVPDPVSVEGEFVTQPPKGSVMPQADNTTPLTRESLERDHAALFSSVRAEFTSVGATAERDRIQAVLGQSMPGFDKLVQGMAFDGKTTGPEAAVAVLKAHREATAGAAAAHAQDAPSAVKPGSAPPSEGEKSKDAQVTEARAYAAQHKVGFIDALKALGYAA